jgi:exopolyphosphatase/guanosine-5'-triphosphate,3'-diphosphate pyrophosphatase
MRYGPCRARSPDCNTVRVIAAAIDVGTNTTRLLVARVEPHHLTSLATDEVMTALGTDLDATGTIAAAGLDLLERTVGAMADRARGLGAERIAIACTAVGRDAANALDPLARIERATGVTPTVFSGEREAALTYQGIVADGAVDELVAADLGGGSLELMGGRPGELAWATSIPVGVRKLTERFASADPPDRSAWQAIVDEVTARVRPVAAAHAAVAIVVTGGSAAALSRLAGSARLDSAALAAAADRLAARPADELHDSTGIDAARLRLCFAGAGALEGTGRAFGLDGLEVSTAGFREGLALEAIR